MRKRTSWQIQKSVVFALLMREMKTRFGSYRLSYAWAVLEPLAHVAVFAIIFGYIIGRTIPGVNYPLFIITGIMPWLMFTNMLNRGMHAISANKALFNYRQLRPLDTIAARMLLEGLIHVGTFAFLLLLAWWTGIEFRIHEPLRIIAAFGLLFALSVGLALPMCYVATLYPELAKVVPMIMRPLYFMSGIFFSLTLVPMEYHAYLDWNPVLQSSEMIRSAIFTNIQTFEDPSYLVMIAIPLLAFGLSFFRHTSRRLLTT